MLKVIIKTAKLYDGKVIENVEAGLLEKVERQNGPQISGYPYSGMFDFSNAEGKLRKSKRRLYFRYLSDFTITDEEFVPMVSEIVENQGSSKPAQTDTRTDEEILTDIREKFETLSLLSKAAADGKIRSMIVTGSAGTGKSYTVMRALDEKEKICPTFSKQVIKGTITPVMLFISLYEMKDAGNVLVLDDCDAVFEEVETLNLLKAATESSKRRTVSYKKMSSALETLGIPTQFTFEGTVIILSNIDLDNGSKKLAPHFEAIASRSHFVSTVFRTAREKILRIISVIQNEHILDDYLPAHQHAEVAAFVMKHSNHFKELSLRTVVKLAELRDSFDVEWEKIARSTLLR